MQNFNSAMKALKSKFSFFFVHNLMILCSKKNWENYPEKYFWTKKKTGLKFNPRLIAFRTTGPWSLARIGITNTSGREYESKQLGHPTTDSS